MKISYFLMLLLASMTLIFTSCDNGESKTKPKDKCEGNTCASEGKVCDPGSGECVAVKACDPECKDGETCNTVTGKCESNTVDLCEDNNCASEGKVCDPKDGSCIDFNVDDLDTIVEARKWSSTYGGREGVILTKKLEGVVVGVKGLKSSSHHAIIVQQAGATEFAAIWVNLDVIKAETDMPDFAVGNLVTFGGKLNEYYDRTEVTPQTTADIAISADTANLPAPVDISSVDYEEKYESMLVNLTNVPFTVTELTNIVKCGEGDTCTTGNCSGTICPGDSKFTYTAKDSAEKSIEIGTSLSYPRVEFTQNEKITAIKGVMTYDHSAIVIFPTSKADVVSDGSLCGGVQCTADQVCANDTCIAKEAEDNDAKCSDGIDNDGNGFVDCDDFSCSKSDTVTVCVVLCGGVECTDNQVCVNDSCVAPEAEDTDAKCSDGIDNDGNGHTDCDDWSCSRNSNVTVCAVECGGVTCQPGQICVDDTCKDVNPENTDALCSDGIDNDNDGHTDCDDYDCSRNPDVTVCGGGNECDPECTDGKVCQDGTCVDVQTVTISDVRAGTTGNVYTTTGIVTAIESKGFYFQDANAGMYVYLGSAPATTVGNNVTVTGKLDEYHNFLELKEATVTDGAAGTMPAPISITGDAMAEAHESMYVSLTGQPFTVTTVGQYDLTMTDANGNDFLLKKSSLTDSLVAGNVLSKLDGVVAQFDNNYRLVLRVAEDMELVNFTCATPCKTWETCTATDTCTLTPGMCDDSGNGCENGFTCNNTTHVCEMTANNDLVNGDLETWADDATPTGWTINSALTAAKESTSVHGGSFSAKVTRDNASATQSWMSEFLSPPVAFDLAKTYNVSIFVLDNDVNVKARIYVRAYDAQDNRLDSAFSDEYSVDGADWQELTYSLDPTGFNSEAKTLRIGLRLYKQDDTTATGDGFILVDDVTLTEVSSK